jgi:hypothetical protein
MKSASLLCLSAALVGSTAASKIRLTKNGQHSDITFDGFDLTVPGHATLNVTDTLSSRIEAVAADVAKNTQDIEALKEGLMSTNTTQ